MGERQEKANQIEKAERDYARAPQLRERVARIGTLIFYCEEILRDGHPDLSPQAIKTKNRKTGKVRERRLYKCQLCLKQFSVTSGKQFHSRKLTFKKFLPATLLFGNGVLGEAGLQLRRDIRCSHKAAGTLHEVLLILLLLAEMNV